MLSGHDCSLSPCLHPWHAPSILLSNVIEAATFKILNGYIIYKLMLIAQYNSCRKIRPLVRKLVYFKILFCFLHVSFYLSVGMNPPPPIVRDWVTTERESLVLCFMSAVALLAFESWHNLFLSNFQLPPLQKKNTQLQCPITKLKACLAEATGYWQLWKPTPQGQDCTLSNPVQSVKYSTFHGWLAPVPPYPQTWLAQINTAPRSTSQPITHSKQIKYEGVWWGEMVFFTEHPAASAGHVCGRGSIDGSIESCGMCEEAHHSIVHWWLLWEWAENILREDEQ